MSSNTVGKSDIIPRNSPGRTIDLFDTECVLLCGLRLCVVFRRGIIKGEGEALSLKRAFWLLFARAKSNAGVRGGTAPRRCRNL